VEKILAIGRAMPAIGDRAVIEAKSAVVKVIVQLIRSLLQGIAELDGKIEEAALSEVSAAKFSRMGRSLDFAIGVGSGLLPATTKPG
jgi:hypothetical protein